MSEYGVGPAGGTYQVLSEQLLKNLPFPEKLAAIESALLAAAMGHNDDVTLEMVELLSTAYHKEEWEIMLREKKTSADYYRGEQRFREHIRRLYWQLPDGRTSLHKGYKQATLFKTKLRIFGEIIKEWGTPRESSVRAFRFLIAAYNPLPEGELRHEGESDDEMQARGRWVFHEEQAATLQLIREHTGRDWRPKDLEFWLQQPYVPEGIQRLLILARARNGGMALVERDLWFAKLLEPLDPEKRSPGALALHDKFCVQLAVIEGSVAELLTSMNMKGDPKWYENWKAKDEVGGSEYVCTEKVQVEYPDLVTVVITVPLEPNCSAVLGTDIFARARSHIERWREKYPTTTVTLRVVGGKDGLRHVRSYGK